MPTKESDQQQKFRVHTYRMMRHVTEVVASDAADANRIVTEDGGEKLLVRLIEDAGEWSPETVVDPILETGMVDYDKAVYFDIRSAADLRREAADLLEKANKLDGLSPFLVAHTHNFGTSVYLGWGKDLPDAESASRILDSEFEEDRGEILSVHDDLTIAELTGSSSTHRFGETAPKPAPKP